MSQAERARLVKELTQRGYTETEIAFLVGPLDSGESSDDR